MIKIAICDDQPIELNKVHELLKEFSLTIRPIDIKIYASSVELSTDFHTLETTDIFLLDIVMPELSGIELGKMIRNKHKDANIIIFTTSSDFALDAFGIQALQYLVKPVNKLVLYDAIKKAIILASKKERYFSIQTRNETIVVKINDIKYVEYMDHFLYFHLNDKIITSKFFRVAFDVAIRELFEHNDFSQVHRAYLINFRHVKKMKATTFEMDNNKSVPISKSRITQARNSYLKYLLKG